jgi:hypothetical protein
MIVQSDVQRVVAMVTTADPFVAVIQTIVVQPVVAILTNVAQHVVAILTNVAQHALH